MFVKVHHAVMSRCSLLWLCFVVSTLPLPASASLFEDKSLLEIELTGPLWSLIENKEERAHWPFRLRSDSAEFDIKIRARGNSRMRVCDFPPLRLEFSGVDTSGSQFEGQSKLKLVTRCNKGGRSDRDVLEEYAAYRIFGLLSDVSYRVRLVHMTYNDIDGRLKKDHRNSYGFLIEPLDQLAARFHTIPFETAAVSLSQLDEFQAALVYMYQYLIGNTDWSLVRPESDDDCCHNINLIKINTKLYPVPYDFDLSGLVNSVYARPDPSMKIKKVRIRKYRGFCTDEKVLRRALGEITSKEHEILNVIKDLPLLTEKEKTRQVDYLEGFFRMADDEDKIIRYFEKNCHP